MPTQSTARPAASGPEYLPPVTAAGSSIDVAADDLLGGGPGAARTVERIAALLAAGNGVSVRLDPGESERHAAGRFVAACARLGRSLPAAGADPARLAVTVDAAAVSPMLAWRARRSLLGPGRVDFLVGRRDLAPSQLERERVRRRWFELWRLRDETACTAFWPEVQSACTLLATEPADALLPPVGLQAPGGSAWLVCALDIDRLESHSGWPVSQALARHIRHALDVADVRFDEIRWPCARQSEDAWLNRRVAIILRGIGNVARRCALDPASSTTFVEFDRLLTTVREVAFEHARQACVGRDPLPAVAGSNPCLRLAPGPLRDAWEARWQRLVDGAAIAHRNLVVMSPWSLYPDGEPDVRYGGLLPLLRHADACAFGRRPRLTGWSLEDFVDLHRRAWALCAHITGRSVVAEQP